MTRQRIVWLAVVASGLASLGLSTYEAVAADENTNTHTIDSVLELALAHNPTMARAQGDMRQRRGQQVAAGAYLNPSISGAAGRGNIRDPSTGVKVTERTVTVEQPLEWQGKRRARQQAADAGAAGASAAMEETRLNVIAEAKVAFYQVLFAQRDAELTGQNLTMVEEVLRTVKARAAAGEATLFESMKATVEVQKAKKEVSRAQNASVVVRAKLDMVTAGMLGKQFSIQGDFDSLQQELDLDLLATRAMEQHPTLRRLGKLVEQAQFSATLERESRIPNVTVLGSYHREAGDESVVAGLSVPLPLWYQRQGEIESALGARYRAEAERLRVQNEITQTITQYVQDVRTANEQLQVFETGLLKQAEQTLRVARISFQQGAASLLDLLDSQRVYRQTLLEYVHARADLSIALAQLERAVGGI
ncbi:MAG: TolC family protein [Nitrospirota bacterium]|nr:TolC family protein [Nitrospirota bacterium]MDP2381259.1 TolC family protein [Nitrospirota bacterium]